MNSLSMFLAFNLLLPGILSYHLAKSRNRDKAKALLVGLWTGWIGLIIMIIFLEKKPLTKKKQNGK